MRNCSFDISCRNNQIDPLTRSLQSWIFTCIPDTYSQFQSPAPVLDGTSWMCLQSLSAECPHKTMPKEGGMSSICGYPPSDFPSSTVYIHLLHLEIDSTYLGPEPTISTGERTQTINYQARKSKDCHANPSPRSLY